MDFGLRQDLDRLIKNDPSLQALSILFRKMGNKGARAMANALARNDSGHLKVLRLACNKIDMTGATYLGNVLSRSKLVDLSICMNPIGDIGCKSIALALCHDTSNLRKLRLEDCEIGDMGATYIGKMLFCNTNLRELNVARNRIGRYGFERVCLGINHNTTLEILNVCSSELGPACGDIFGAVLGQNTTSLREVDLSNNKIGDIGASALGKSLFRNSSLKKLNLYQNDIGDSGAVDIAHGLTGGSMLQMIELGENFITDVGAIAIGSVLPRMSAELKVISLHNNRIGKRGILAIRKGIQYNVSLEEIGLGFSYGIDEEILICKINHILKLNWAGRRMLTESSSSDAIWVNVLERIINQPDCIYFFLREKPNLIQSKRS